MKRRSIEKLVVMIVFFVLELVVLGGLIWLLAQHEDFPEEQVKKWRGNLITLMAGLGIVYVLYVQVRARRLGEHLLGEKIKTHVLLESLPQGLLVLDPEGMIVAANERGCAALGIDPVLSLGGPIAKFLEEETASTLAGDSAGRFAGAALGRPGRKLQFQVHRLRGGQGKVVAVEEAAAPASEAAAPRAGLPAPPGALLDVLARTIDRAVAEARAAGAAGRRALAEARLAAHRLSHYAEGAEAVPERMDRREADVAGVLEPVLGAMGTIAEARGARLEVAREGTLTAAVDAGWLRRAVEEVLANAVAFVPEGGQVKVRLAGDGGDLTVSVQDNGPGIADEELPRVTEAGFAGSKAATGSRGLGLALARRVAEAHGGSLRIESRVGVGTRANLTIPRAAGR